jgi:hypothetical protein
MLAEADQCSDLLQIAIVAELHLIHRNVGGAVTGDSTWAAIRQSCAGSTGERNKQWGKLCQLQDRLLC